jgi:hypothetical protein
VELERRDPVDATLADLSSSVVSGAIGGIPVVGGVVGGFLTQFQISRLSRAVDELTRRFNEVSEMREVEVEVLLEHVRDDLAQRNLATAAFDAASAIDDEAFRQLAGRILREGLLDDALVDESRLMLKTLNMLEPVHLKVLGLIAGFCVSGDGRSVDAPMPMFAIASAWPQGRTPLPAIVGSLEAAGLVREQMHSPDQLLNPDKYPRPSEDPLARGPLGFPTDNRNGWALTSYGHRFIELATAEPAAGGATDAL